MKIQRFFYLTGLTCFTFSLINCGQPTVSTDYDEVLIPYQQDKGRFWGFMKLSGDVVIGPSFPKMPTTMWQGWALTREAGRGQSYQFIDDSGKLWEQTFSQVTYFHENRAIATLQSAPDRTGYLNRQGIFFIVKKEESKW